MQTEISHLTQAPLSGTHALALYELTVSDGKFKVREAWTPVPFDFVRYSEFKYGQRDAAEIFAASLADLLLAHFGGRLGDDEQVVVIGTPYKRLPNAARMLAIITERHLRTAGLPTSYSYIYQHRLAEGDYGRLPQAARDERNRQKKRYIDADDFTGKHVVVIDDVRITGSIERSIHALLSEIPVLSTTVVNLVRLDPDVAASEPHLEDRLNHAAVQGLPDLLRLMNQRSQFTLTTRAVKFILQAEPAEVRWLLDRLDPTQVTELYEAIVDEGYDLMTAYRPAFRLVQEACQTSVSPLTLLGRECS